MVVVDQGKRALGRTIEVVVTSVLQTTAGKMIFCRWPEAGRAGRERARRDRGRPRSARTGATTGEPPRSAAASTGGISDRREPGERPAPSTRAARGRRKTGRRPPRRATDPRSGTSRGWGGRLAFFLVQAPLALLATAAYSAAAFAAALVDRSGRLTRRIGGAWSRLLLRVLQVGVRVSGLEHAVAGPAVYAANHASALDVLVVFGHLPIDFRIVYKRSLSLVPLLGWAIWLGGHVPINRANPFRARRSLDAAARRIRGGTASSSPRARAAWTASCGTSSGGASASRSKRESPSCRCRSSG